MKPQSKKAKSKIYKLLKKNYVVKNINDLLIAVENAGGQVFFVDNKKIYSIKEVANIINEKTI